MDVDKIINVQICNSLKHIKNKTFLSNTYDPLNQKFVKEIWAYKKTKLDRLKRDLVWVYFRDRGKKSVTKTFKDYANNGKLLKIVVIYFNDCKQYTYEKSEELIAKIKNIDSSSQFNFSYNAPQVVNAQQINL